jgi:hypothetical protein
MAGIPQLREETCREFKQRRNASWSLQISSPGRGAGAGERRVRAGGEKTEHAGKMRLEKEKER